MKITVCIKQVPGTSQVEIDPVTGVLKRDGVAAKLNPYDLYALETAIRLKERYGAVITVITMGPPQAKAVIEEAFMTGADRGFLISDRKFGGADVLATSYTISQGIRAAGEFDLIICGKQTTDGDTAQVGAELAEFLDVPHVTGVCELEEISDSSLIAMVDMPLHVDRIKVAMPCLITVEKGIYHPRLPSYRLMKATQGREITTLTMAEMPDKNPNHYGLNGSPTQVKRIFPPEKRDVSESWQGSGEELAVKLADYLEENKFLQQMR